MDRRCPSSSRECDGSLELSLHYADGIWFKTLLLVGSTNTHHAPRSSEARCVGLTAGFGFPENTH